MLSGLEFTESAPEGTKDLMMMVIKIKKKIAHNFSGGFQGCNGALNNVGGWNLNQYEVQPRYRCASLNLKGVRV